jgi:hypothetical protein
MGKKGSVFKAKRQVRTFVASGTDGSFKINARPDKSRKGYESLSENDKIWHWENTASIVEIK